MSDLAERARWDARFASADYVFGTAPNAFLTAQRALLPKRGTALALADGEGRNGVFLAECGLDVLSTDVSPVGLAKAEKLAAARKVKLLTELADVAVWDFGRGRFDVVAAIFIQFAGPELRARIFEGIRQTLKPGGLLLLQGYRPEQLAYKTGGPPHAENLYTEELLRGAFGDWHILQLRVHDDTIAEGTGHVGMSALIDLVARKP
ncbi:MAG: class I SAM-dependent methyltransferase [Alphaproteobacteria bacterium]